MPQLDLGIFFAELFANSLCFWSLYIFKAKKVLPLLNKTLKLRKYKLKTIALKLNSFENNLLFVNFNNKIVNEDISIFYNILLNNLKQKINIFNKVLILTNYNSFLKNNSTIKMNYLNNLVYQINLFKK